MPSTPLVGGSGGHGDGPGARGRERAGDVGGVSGVVSALLRHGLSRRAPARVRHSPSSVNAAVVLGGMIVVHTRVRCHARHRDAFIAILQQLQDATRREDGCLEYSYVADLDDDCLFVGVEEWRDEAALRAHLAAPHMNDPDSRFDAYSREPETVRVFTAQPLDL